MNTRLSANLSVLGTSLMLILSFSFGFHSYTEAKKTIVTDLNQALQQTILQNSHLWMSQDSIRTYANLSKLFGNPVSIESYNKDFSDALSYTPDKKKTGIVIHVLNKDPQTENAPANTNKKLNEYYIASDTIIWASSIANSPNTATDHIGISFQGYANCSTRLSGYRTNLCPAYSSGLPFYPLSCPYCSNAIERN